LSTFLLSSFDLIPKSTLISPSRRLTEDPDLDEFNVSELLPLLLERERLLLRMMTKSN
jgi:hypothetical protein